MTTYHIDKLKDVKYNDWTEGKKIELADLLRKATGKFLHGEPEKCCRVQGKRQERGGEISGAEGMRRSSGAKLKLFPSNSVWWVASCTSSEWFAAKYEERLLDLRRASKLPLALSILTDRMLFGCWRGQLVLWLSIPCHNTRTLKGGV